MNPNKVKTVAVITLGALLFAAFGCILNPKKDKDPPPPPSRECKPLTDKENVISNLMYAYETYDIQCYETLLDENYYFYFQEEDVAQGSPVLLDRALDLQVMDRMFGIANKKYTPGEGEPNIASITLIIYYSNWAAVDTLNGQPCDDCWMTDRVHDLTLDTGEDQYRAYDRSVFIVRGLMVGGVKQYRLAAQYDIFTQD